MNESIQIQQARMLAYAEADINSMCGGGVRWKKSEKCNGTTLNVTIFISGI